MPVIHRPLTILTYCFSRHFQRESVTIAYKQAARRAKKGPRRTFSHKSAPGSNPSPVFSNSAVVCLGIAAATLLLYSRSFGYGFTDYDDPNYVTQNPHVSAGLTWDSIGWAFRSVEAANWHPITWLSHALDSSLYGANAAGPHVTSVLIHLVNALLIFFLLKSATRAPGTSFVVAALFAWHPFNVESVVWIAERKNVLSTLFLLLTLAAYGRYVRLPERKRCLIVVLLFALGLATKPMLVTLPFALLLLDYWPLLRLKGISPKQDFGIVQVSFAHSVIEKIPLFALSAASCVITVIAQKKGNAVAEAQALPYWARLANASRAAGLYIWKTLWPSGFAIHYPNPFDPILSIRPGAKTWLEIVAGALLVSLVSVLVWRQRRVRPYLIVGWLWFLGTLVPVIGFVQVGTQGMADRYAYVPLIGLFVMAAFGGSDVGPRLGISPALQRGGVALVLLTLCVLSFLQIGHWETNYKLWLQASEVSGGNYLADDHLGLLLQQMGSPEAIHYFEESIRLAPRDPIARCAVAINLEDQGLFPEAISHFQAVIQQPLTRRFQALALAHVGIIYGEEGDYAQSRENLERSRQVEPGVVDNLIAEFSHSVALRHSDETYVRLGILLAQKGQNTEARAAFEKALEVNPARAGVQSLLSQLPQED
jgi:protein O-mannosyl-transferase